MELTVCNCQVLRDHAHCFSLEADGARLSSMPRVKRLPPHLQPTPHGLLANLQVPVAWRRTTRSLHTFVPLRASGANAPCSTLFKNICLTDPTLLHVLCRQRTERDPRSPKITALCGRFMRRCWL
jgi:hypothetical protein